MSTDQRRDAGAFVRHYRTSLIIAAAALVVAVAWAVVAFVQLGGEIRDLPRTEVPGELTLEIDEPTGLVVYDERRSWTTPIGGPYPDIEVEGPDGEVDVAPYRAVMNYRWWRTVGQARATFEADEPGTYTLTAEGEPPSDARVTVGPSFATPMLGALLGPVLVLTIGLLVAAGVAAYLASRRRGASNKRTG